MRDQPNSCGPCGPPDVRLPFELVRLHGDLASAIGAGELPFGMPVEVEAIVAFA